MVSHCYLGQFEGIASTQTVRSRVEMVLPGWGSGYPTMTSEDEGVGFLRVELGKFARTTRISAERVSRELAFSNCLVTSWTVMSLGDVTKLSKDSFREGEILELSVRESMPGDVLWNEEPEKIGVVDADRMHCDVILPPHVFAAIWSAAGANDNSSVELELKAGRSEILSVTNVALFEAMLQCNSPVGIEPTQRLNAILVELREIELTPLIRSATFWFFAALGVLIFFIVWQNSP